MIKKPWKKTEENEFLTILYNQTKFPNWKEISKTLQSKNINKTPQQCCNRWYNNKNKKNYKIKFSQPKKKFSIEEEKKLLKLSFEFSPKWNKISEHFINRDRFDVTNHFYCIMRKGLRKAFKLLGKKNSSYILWKIKPKLYSILISQDIKIDFRGFKQNFLGECKDFEFINFFVFVTKFYFYDFEEIWGKICEREIFIVKKVLVYIMDFNLRYNRYGNMTERKQNEFLKMEKIFLENKNNIIRSFGDKFSENNFDNKISIIKIDGRKTEENKIIEKNEKISFSFQKKNFKNEINNQILPLKNSHSKKIQNLKLITKKFLRLNSDSNNLEKNTFIYEKMIQKNTKKKNLVIYNNSCYFQRKKLI